MSGPVGAASPLVGGSTSTLVRLAGGPSGAGVGAATSRPSVTGAGVAGTATGVAATFGTVAGTGVAGTVGVATGAGAGVVAPAAALGLPKNALAVVPPRSQRYVRRECDR